MKWTGTRLFETVHPMTYFFVIQSIVWGLLVIVSLLFAGSTLYQVVSLYWPVPVAYIWSVAVIIGALVQLWFLLRDSYDRSRKRIWNCAKINLAIWAFSPVLWILIGAYSMMTVSLFSIVGFSYIGLANRFNLPRQRV